MFIIVVIVVFVVIVVGFWWGPGGRNPPLWHFIIRFAFIVGISIGTVTNPS
jgi:hypothetical protein